MTRNELNIYELNMFRVYLETICSVHPTTENLSSRYQFYCGSARISITFRTEDNIIFRIKIIAVLGVEIRFNKIYFCRDYTNCNLLTIIKNHLRAYGIISGHFFDFNPEDIELDYSIETQFVPLPKSISNPVSFNEWIFYRDVGFRQL